MKTKEMKGITLVALVVTIVVLLILAAVSINLVLGDNGIIKKANQAASVTKEAEVKEAINRTILEFYLTNDYETLEDFLKAKAEDGSIDSVSKNADGTLTIRKGDYSVTVENKTNSLGGSGSGGSTGGETQTPEITIGEAKVVANSDGTGDALGEASTYLENTLYITFTHSITEGTTTVEPAIPYAVTANGTYKFTVTGTVNGKNYTKEVSVTVNQFKDTYEYMDKNTEVTYPDGKVWVPEGFKIADDSSEDVQGGVVIEDKAGNQFVWVPVDTIDAYKRIGYIDVGSVPYQWYLETLEDDEKKSVDTYKGFYIGRYEAGDKESTEAKKLRGSNDVTKTVTIKKGQAPYNYVKKTQAVSLAEGFAKQQKYSETIKTKLLSSYAWDTALAFIKKTVNDYPYSSPQGNYVNTKFEYIDITGASQTKWSGSGGVIPTGLTTSVCNIYDMGGNVEEWTTEKYSPRIKTDIVNPDGSTSTSEKSYYNVCRGGFHGFKYSREPYGSGAGCRYPKPDEAEQGQNIGFRIALFLQ